MEKKQPSSWYIPRPSLTSTTKNHQDAIRRYHRDSEVIDIEKPKRNSSSAKFSSSSSSTISSQHSKDRQICMETCLDGNGECETKRGSRSSQGSSDSEQSIHSASSLLLTVANLENFVKIQEQSSRHHYHTSPFGDNRIISINPSKFLSPSKIATKEADQQSTASSTHFTMVNGFGRTQSNNKSSFICKRSRQVTVLIVTMSLLFLIGIFTAVILLEMRNREMPR